MVYILIVEDDVNFNNVVCSYLNNNGYTAVGCHSAAEALDQMEKMSFDMIISDIMMKNMDGFEFAEQVRLINKDIPILFLTAREDLQSKEKGYKLGIDDYIVKPVEMKEMLFRIEAILRRANIANKKKIVVGNLVLDSAETAAYVNGENIGLSVKEFNILFKLLSYPKRTFTRTQLMNDFWGYETESAPRTVDVCITKLRSKLSVSHDVEIVTVHGLGYKAVMLV
ncbi:MAG: response regulator transcription factor [Ruminococcaceae bacterium]|jgi:DNA-binding response OmpR family regulator|nr:response regulator transcription factor [Oscillospiraceae bacterium]